MMSVVEEHECLSGVHPSDRGINGIGVTHDVGNGAIERLAVLTLLSVLISVLVKETVWVIETCFLEAEVVGSLGNTVHVVGVDCEVKTDRVSVDVAGGGLLFGGSSGFGVLCGLGSSVHLVGELGLGLMLGEVRILVDGVLS